MSSRWQRIFRWFDAGDLTAFVTWALVFAITVYLFGKSKTAPDLIVYAPGFTLYIISFFIATREPHQCQLAPAVQVGGLVTMLLCAFYLHLTIDVDFLSILTIIWVAVLAYYVPYRWAIVITLIVVFGWYLVSLLVHGKNAWIQALLYATFHFFAVMLSLSNQREKKTSQQLKVKNDQLLATQELLAQVSRQTERTRIARDLHDLVGHHLTALTIKLQVASRVSEGEAKQQVDQCYDIARVLLNDVRDAVDSLRNTQSIDITQALKLLTQNIPVIQFSMNIPAQLSIENIAIAETVVRCVQEAITNTIKHSGATQAWIDIALDNECLVAQYYDNGRINKDWRKGNGLTGMFERVDAVAGELQLELRAQALNYRWSFPLTTGND
ncbi:MAG: sensor histidine kinase [Gammaproteobacteria bacterium]|nr:sensor histidine kinase [Gammaproteobacteria bacterium]NVK87208.1 sensor histidine kinase [Gammaproteobacteria bacterium]